MLNVELSIGSHGGSRRAMRFRMTFLPELATRYRL